MNNFEIKFSNTPRWIIFLIDIFIAACSVFLSYALRFDFDMPAEEWTLLPKAFILFIIVRSISYVISHSYTRIVRYTNSQDFLKLLLVILGGTIIVFILNQLIFYFKSYYLIPRTVIMIEFFITSFLLITFRISIKLLLSEMMILHEKKKNVVIFGAGESGMLTKKVLETQTTQAYKIIAFIDDNHKKVGNKYANIRVYDVGDLKMLSAKQSIDSLIIAIQSLDADRKKELIELCLQLDIEVLNVPAAKKWIDGELSFSQIKKVKVEDLLERKSIKLNTTDIANDISGKIVMVTGAAGSIGSEIVRQLVKFNPKKVLCLDQAETPLHNLDLELIASSELKSYETLLCDIKSKHSIQYILGKYKPDIIYHAAAYKHVPMMENNPQEAVKTNIGGTKNLADAAIKHGVKKFIMISSDKAVNPTNVMGASKRVAEIYIQTLNSKHENIQFITTRFGNVLGSNGSVIPLFEKQILEGGPLTITHPDVVRYFMTIPEACQLVLEAGSMGKGGEVFLFDMGSSVKIVDLARKMIKLSGYKPDKEIAIVYTGLRPGEKLFEELLIKGENLKKTHHEKIMIAQTQNYHFEEVNDSIQTMLAQCKEMNNFDIVRSVKKLVPEFKSQNSIYQQLD